MVSLFCAGRLSSYYFLHIVPVVQQPVPTPKPASPVPETPQAQVAEVKDEKTKEELEKEEERKKQREERVCFNLTDMVLQGGDNLAMKLMFGKEGKNRFCSFSNTQPACLFVPSPPPLYNI